MNYLRIASLAILAVVLIGSGYKMGAYVWKAKYNAEISAQWQTKAKGEEKAREALEQQLTDARVVTDNNSSIIVRLQNANSQIIADRDNVGAMARRLLASQARPCPRPDHLPEASGGPAAAGTGEAPGDGPAARLLADAAVEARLNATQLDALSAEIRPQL